MTEYSDDTTIVAVDDQISTEVEGETVILQLEDGKYYGIDGIGPRIWELVQEPKRIDEIERQLADEYDVAHDRIERDIDSFLETLDGLQLIERRDG